MVVSQVKEHMDERCDPGHQLFSLLTLSQAEEIPESRVSPDPALTRLVGLRYLQKKRFLTRSCSELKADGPSIARETTGQRERGKPSRIERACHPEKTGPKLLPIG